MKLWKNLSNRERLWICLAIIVLIIAAADRLILMPVTGKMAQMDARISTRKQELATCYHILAMEPEIRQEFAKYATGLKRIGSDEKETSRALGIIENLARSCAVVLVDTKPRQVEDKGWYNRLVIEIEAEAAPKEFIAFLYALNTVSDVMRVEKLQVAPKDRNSNTLRASLMVSKLVGNQASDTLPES